MGQKFTDSLSQDGLNVGLRYEEGGGGGEKSEIRNQKSNFIEIRNPISPISPEIQFHQNQKSYFTDFTCFFSPREPTECPRKRTRQARGLHDP